MNELLFILDKIHTDNDTTEFCSYLLDKGYCSSETVCSECPFDTHNALGTFLVDQQD